MLKLTFLALVATLFNLDHFISHLHLLYLLALGSLFTSVVIDSFNSRLLSSFISGLLSRLLCWLVSRLIILIVFWFVILWWEVL